MAYSESNVFPKPATVNDHPQFYIYGCGQVEHNSGIPIDITKGALMGYLCLCVCTCPGKLLCTLTFSLCSFLPQLAQQVKQVTVSHM